MSSRVAPEFHDQIAEAIDDGRVLTEIRCAVDVSHSADPLRDAIEFPEFALEGCEHGKAGQTCGLVPLVDSQVPADETLNKRRGTLEWPVSSDVGEPVVDLDELESAGRDKGLREGHTELFEVALDPAHRAQRNSLEAGARNRAVQD